MEIKPIFSAMMRSKTGVILISLQIALTLAILVNALYVVRDKTTEANRMTGLDDDNTFLITILDKNADDAYNRQRRDETLLKSIPGVVGVATTSQMPLTGNGSNNGLRLDPKQPDSSTAAAYYVVSENFVDAMQLKIIEGRNLTNNDMIEVDENLPDQPKAKVALVTQTLAKKLFPNEKSAVGKVFYSDSDRPIEIIGVIETLVDPWGRVNWNGNQRDGNESYVLGIRLKTPHAFYAVRTEPGQIDRVMKEAEKSLLAAMPGRMLGQNDSMATIRENRYQNEHTIANGLLIVIGLLLLMTACGIIGLASLWVNQRRKQIGVRRALGARRIDILRYFITENIIICGIGIAIGSVLAIALNHVLMNQLELQRLPLVYLLYGAIALLLLGVAAVMGPAWRASLIAPAIATRSA
jgi:putative ABC transport system permease protein